MKLSRGKSAWSGIRPKGLSGLVVGSLLLLMALTWVGFAEEAATKNEMPNSDTRGKNAVSFRIKPSVLQLSGDAVDWLNLTGNEVMQLVSLFADLDSDFRRSLINVPLDEKGVALGMEVQLALPDGVGASLRKSMRSRGEQILGLRRWQQFEKMAYPAIGLHYAGFDEGEIYLAKRESDTKGIDVRVSCYGRGLTTQHSNSTYPPEFRKFLKRSAWD